MSEKTARAVMPPTHVVILRRTGFETLLKAGSQEECEEAARSANVAFQTDEYKVEPYDPEKVMK